MAVVAGVVFFAVRALLALIPALTVSFPIKKWAAVYQAPARTQKIRQNMWRSHCGSGLI
jgi:hypothetical protein